MKRPRKVILASNRGPVSFTTSGGEVGWKRGGGGLAGALDPVARSLGQDALWICAATSDVDRQALGDGALSGVEKDLGYPLHMIDIDRDLYRSYYDDVSNLMLWFALHRLSDEVGATQKLASVASSWENAYVPVNELFAEEVCRAAAPGASVLVQDYHLALVPRLVKTERPDVSVLHFTHSSFSGPDGLHVLPPRIRHDLVSGLAGADIVGFHVPAWCQGFLAATGGVGEVDEEAGSVGSNGHRAWVRSYPIQIDCAEANLQASEPEALQWAQTFTPPEGHLLVARTDRLEPSKNIVVGFEAFGRLLDRRPDLAQRTRFVACCYPSRAGMEEYSLYREKVVESAEEVIRRHPGSIELYLDDDYPRSLGLLAVADVFLVNPSMDGMNLVSKEAVCVSRRDGTLVLSRLAGSFDELGPSSIVVHDPSSAEETSLALETALGLDPAQRKEHLRALRGALQERHPNDWIAAQLEDLKRVREGRAPSGWLLSHRV